MTPVDDHSTATNPFSTRWTRPGAIAYQFAAGDNVETLVHRLRNSNWCGALVGPHGSGKSTLLAALIPAIEQAGRTVRSITLHDGQKRLPSEFLLPRQGDPPGVVVIDGYEQLGWWSRRRLKATCRKSGWGLVVTVHDQSRTDGLPVLHQTKGDLTVLQRMINEHLPPHQGVIRQSDIANAFETHHGNLRDALFALYDLFEQRRR
jgi:hypothetical protein